MPPLRIADEYSANLRAIVQYVRDVYGAAPRILLITPPPIDGPSRLEYQREQFGSDATGVLERTDESAGAYAAQCQAVGDALGVPVLNFWSAVHRAATEAEGGLRAFLCDGLHLSGRGNQLLFAELLQCIGTHYPDLMSAAMPLNFPLATEVDWCAAVPGGRGARDVEEGVLCGAVRRLVRHRRM